MLKVDEQLVELEKEVSQIGSSDDLEESVSKLHNICSVAKKLKDKILCSKQVIRILKKTESGNLVIDAQGNPEHINFE